MTTTEGGGDPIVLRLSGEVDALSQLDYRRTAEQLLADSSSRTLIVDMQDVSTIDSSGLGLLVHLQSLTRDGDVAMVLRHVPPRAEALLKRTGLNRVFTIDTV